jgi:hypothetical protein
MRLPCALEPAVVRADQVILVRRRVRMPRPGSITHRSLDFPLNSGTRDISPMWRSPRLYGSAIRLTGLRVYMAHRLAVLPARVAS